MGLRSHLLTLALVSLSLTAEIPAHHQVSDESTSLLMQRFYEFLASGELTKAEALLQAQLSLLYDQDVDTRLEAVRGGEVFFEVATWDGQPANGTPATDHPYYWAPFILIGNAL